jgi:hypothetical protein
MEVWFHTAFVDASPGGVFRVDVDRGVMEWVARVQERNGGGFPINSPTAEAAGFSYQRDFDWVTVHRDGTTSTAARSVLGNILAIDSAGLWLEPFSSDSNASLRRIDRRDPSGAVTSFNLPGESYVPIAAGNGQFVVRTPDQRQFIFDTATGAITPLKGSVYAARSNGAYVALECSDTLVCASVYRGTDGVARPLALVSEGEVALSPDGEWVIRSEPTYQSQTSVLIASNPVTGERVDIGLVSTPGGGSLGAWSADGRWLVAPTVAGLAFWRPGLTSSFVLPIGTGRLLVDALAVGRAPA